VWLLISSLALELLPPAREFLESTGVARNQIKLLIVCQGKLYNEDPNEEVKVWLVDMVEEVFFDTTPTAA